MRVAFITGVTGGLGSSIAKKMLQSGIKVFGSTTDLKRTQESRRILENQGATVVELDITEFGSCKEAISKVISLSGKIDILVNNAGITSDSTFSKMERDQWEKVLNVNLHGTFNITHAVLPAMLKNQWGRIINISSVNGAKGQFGQTNYSASKSGLYGFTKSLAFELARKGITVNSVSPGYLKTEMVAQIPSKIIDQIISTIPVGRLGEPDEIAELVAFICSEKSGFITGSDFAINGGQY